MGKSIDFKVVRLKNDLSENRIFYHLGECNFIFAGCEKYSCDSDCFNKCGMIHYNEALKGLKIQVKSVNNKII